MFEKEFPEVPSAQEGYGWRHFWSKANEFNGHSFPFDCALFLLCCYKTPDQYIGKARHPYNPQIALSDFAWEGGVGIFQIY